MTEKPDTQESQSNPAPVSLNDLIKYTEEDFIKELQEAGLAV